jgi:Fe-S-cluster-containing hydrogenase component 2
MVCPFGAPQPFRQLRKIIKCDRCQGMEALYCVESCPTHALQLIDPEEIAKGKLTLARKERWTGLNFLPPKGSKKSNKP